MRRQGNFHRELAVSKPRPQFLHCSQPLVGYSRTTISPEIPDMQKGMWRIRRFRRYVRRLLQPIDAILPVRRRLNEFVVAGMATMPSRAVTFSHALRSIVRQVDKLYLYLDGHAEPPDWVTRDHRIVPILSRDVAALHANGKMLGLALEQRECLYVTVDDDIYYPRNFVTSLRAALASYGDGVVIGYHGSVLARPLRRYNLNRTIYSYASGLKDARRVDVLGTGAVMFSSRVLRFDVRRWPFTNMVDLGLALEAAKANVPIVSAARKPDSVLMLADHQADSIYAGLKSDDSRQTELARQLLQLCEKRLDGALLT